MILEAALTIGGFSMVTGSILYLQHHIMKGAKDERKVIDEVLEVKKVNFKRNDKVYKPKMKKKIPHSWGTEYVYNFPPGLEYSKAKECIPALQDALHKEVEVTNDYYLHFEVYDQPLKNDIPFNPELMNEAEKDCVVPLGVNRKGEVHWYDFEGKYPHLLMAGITGGGKSSVLRIMISWLGIKGKADLYLMDLKGGVEFTIFENLPNVVDFKYDLDGGLSMIQKVEKEMMSRYEKMRKNRVNHYKTLQLFPIVLFFDEMAILNTKNSSDNKETKKKKQQIKQSLAVIASQGRGSGVFLVCCTQRPSYEVIDGLIKANFNATIALPVRSEIESKIILDNTNATKLEKTAGRSLVQTFDEVKLQMFNLSQQEAQKLIQPYLVEKETVGEADEPKNAVKPKTTGNITKLR
jgi:hypothetical protein